MEEGILDVKLMDGPAPRESKTEDNADGSRLDDRAEGFIIVHPEALVEATDHPPSLVPGQFTCRAKFVAEKPLARNNILVRGGGY